MIAKVYSAFPHGLSAKIVEIEVEIVPGLRAFHIIGLADEAVREAAERVNSAVRCAGFQSPSQMNKKITINLAPADIKKQGSFFDVAIATGFLIASGQISLPVPNVLFVGELTLGGYIRPVPGLLGIGVLAKEKAFSDIIIPEGNAQEASLLSGITVRRVNALREIPHLFEEGNAYLPLPPAIFSEGESEYDVQDIKGQEYAKRALEIAAAGGHHVFMVGPPGAGKSILAKTFPSFLPPLTLEEGLEVATILSSIQPLTVKPDASFILSRPFRSPHHTASAQAVLGGGTPIKPGEITLSHKGVLFLDEFPEFRRDVLEGLRQPLEEKVVKIARSNERFCWPANFQLIAASNPCPCGFKDDPKEPCICSPGSLNRYQRKFSGPLMDRIDIAITMPRLSKEEILREGAGKEASGAIRERVKKVHAIAAKRFRGSRANSEMTLKEMKKFAAINEECKTFIGKAIESLNLSMRAYHKILKIGRTIADLDESEGIRKKHLMEALQYNRKNF